MNGTNRRARRVWAGGTDQILAGMRYVGLFGELDLPSVPVLNDALATIAAAGPHTRVALTPRPGERIWVYDPAVTVPVHQLPGSVEKDGSEAMLEHVRRRTGERRPLEVHVAQRHILLDIDHGLGDVSFALALIVAMFAHSHGGTTPWVAHGDTPLPLPRALGRTFAFHPARARAVGKYAARMRSTHAAVPAESVPWSPSSAVALARVSTDVESAVNEWRHSNAHGSGSASVWLYVVRQALAAAGLRMAENVTVACDCRRYLEQGRTVNSNFMCGVDIPLAANEKLSTVATRLREVTGSAVPLAGMGAVSARAILSARRNVRPSSRQAGAPAELFYSDIGRITSLDDLPWLARDERWVTGLLDPGTPNSVTVLNLRFGAERILSISFHDNVFDRRVIDTVADYLRNPIQLLASDVAP